jgi:predicted RNA-binding Zn-ribbon protein involved in translation (DUF1610 family)
MSRKEGDQPKSSRVLAWVSGYLYLTATVVALVGFFLLSTAWATRDSGDRWLNGHDPLLGFNNRAMLVVGGLLHLAVASYLFAGRDVLNRTLAVLWLGLNHWIYFAGVQWTEPNALMRTERFLGWRLQLQPEAVVLRWKIFQGYLIVASAVFLILIWRHSALLKKEVWFTQWRERRAQPPKKGTISPKAVQPEDNDTRMVCSHCGQKIAFPPSRSGESAACPSCGQTVMLRSKLDMDD